MRIVWCVVIGYHHHRGNLRMCGANPGQLLHGFGSFEGVWRKWGHFSSKKRFDNLYKVLLSGRNRPDLSKFVIIPVSSQLSMSFFSTVIFLGIPSGVQYYPSRNAKRIDTDFSTAAQYWLWR